MCVLSQAVCIKYCMVFVLLSLNSYLYIFISYFYLTNDADAFYFEA